jgi:hypothetical protein
MVENDAPAAAHPDRIALGPALIAKARAQITNHDLIRFDNELVILERDAVTRRGLASDRDTRFRNSQRALQSDRAGDLEDDDARPTGFDRGAQTARARIVQIDDFEYSAPATAQRQPSRSFGAGKRRQLSCCGRLLARTLARCTRRECSC